ncbi:hypothetical protein N0V93_001407 [Gnomoniopsis smithogilvyi]|uniref:Uncharacterized protein n=1 Tax=Gnomoniopsis smithogilvyi TaxID=1191159 RepID=A0A9W8Z3P9_9PEZI|nr:hypothetical protein N0V93_001407 [Gnomoniopsis smithogilvyi]
MRFAQAFGILVSIAGIANGLNARIPKGDTEIGLQQRNEEPAPPSLRAAAVALRDEDENQISGIHMQRAAAKVTSKKSTTKTATSKTATSKTATSKTATSKTATSTAAVATKTSQTSSATTSKATGTTLSTVTTSRTSSSLGVASSPAAGASKTCAAKAARALRSLRRTDSDSSDYSDEGEATMGQKKHLPKSEQVAVVGVDGCTALFIFGSASREFAHLQADKVTEEATAAAQEAISANVVEDGEVITISIRSPDQPTANSVKSTVETALQSKNAQITWDVSTYPYTDVEACYEFSAAANSNTVTMRNDDANE